MPAAFLPATRHIGRKRRQATSPTPPPAGLMITSVSISPAVDTQLIVTFSGAITWDGSTTPQAFKAWTHDEMMDSCIGVIDVGPDWIEVEFNAGVDAGAAWEVVGVMEGITPAAAWPQSGVVS